MKLEFDELKWYGRNFDYNDARYFDYSLSGFEFCFTGTKAVATILSDPADQKDTEHGILGVYVTELASPEKYKGDSFWDNFNFLKESKTPGGSKELVRVSLDQTQNEITLFQSEIEKTVVIKVLKLSECAFGYAGLKNLEIEGTLRRGRIIDSKAHPKIEFIGDSITCGYGVEGIWEKDTFCTGQERPDKAYAFLTARTLKAEFQLCSWSGIGITSNYVDPATVNLPDTHWLMPACWPYTDKSGELRLHAEPHVWDESRFSPNIIVINLGTNDISWVRGIEERRLAYVAGLRQFIEAVHRRSPDAKICCCLGIMGQELCDSVEEACKLFSMDFPSVPVKTLRFDLQKESDGIGADWHPSPVTHKKAAKKLAKFLKEWVEE